MNILDITNEDIARLRQNKIVFGLLPERDREILRFVGHRNCLYYGVGGFNYTQGSDFADNVVYIVAGFYILPSPTEVEIIKYLQASEVPPAQWHPAAQEWARRHDENGVWECKLTTGVWAKTVFIISPVSGAWYSGPHRLRADYGLKILREPEGYHDVAKYYEDEPKKPEVCVWVFNPCYAAKCWIGPHNQIRHFVDECYKFCPDCGKEIVVRNKP